MPGYLSTLRRGEFLTEAQKEHPSLSAKTHERQFLEKKHRVDGGIKRMGEPGGGERIPQPFTQTKTRLDAPVP